MQELLDVLHILVWLVSGHEGGDLPGATGSSDALCEKEGCVGGGGALVDLSTLLPNSLRG
ncbi:hypothetical protein [Streptomyces sp. NPDC006510]|uniref:hypothetical protein n=1 Tax=Streptomyces sp. NPDC006510 TaxID=3155600 RepID=UPI0033AD83AE